MNVRDWVRAQVRQLAMCICAVEDDRVQNPPCRNGYLGELVWSGSLGGIVPTAKCGDQQIRQQLGNDCGKDLALVCIRGADLLCFMRWRLDDSAGALHSNGFDVNQCLTHSLFRPGCFTGSIYRANRNRCQCFALRRARRICR